MELLCNRTHCNLVIQIIFSFQLMMFESYAFRKEKAVKN